MHIKTAIEVRKKLLVRLLHELEIQEESILNALYADFKKPAFEGLVTETALVKSELKFTIKNINKWAKRETVWPSLVNFPSITSANKIGISWAKPGFDGGSEIVDYTIEYAK